MEDPTGAARLLAEDDACDTLPFTGLNNCQVGSLDNVSFNATAVIPFVFLLLPSFDWKYSCSVFADGFGIFSLLGYC